VGKNAAVNPRLLRRDDGDLSLQHQGSRNFTSFPSGAEPPDPPFSVPGADGWGKR
jgi:hypothetical protein